MKINLPVGLTQTIGRQLLTAKRVSPGAMFFVGVAGTVVSTVLACRATLQLPGLIDDCQHELELVKSAVDQNPSGDTRKDVAYVYAKSAIRMTRLYGPSVLVGAGSIGLLTGSHVTLNRRNTGLTAAYSALSATYEKYQSRVVAEVGVDRELELRNNGKFATVLVDGVEEKVFTPVGDGLDSPYARVFDRSNRNWDKNTELNQMFIRCQETYLNQRLHAYGHVFLNEAYDALGLSRSSAGQVVGWLRGSADNYIDFGLYSARNAAYLIHGDQEIVLDFNVDGPIYKKIGQ